MKPRTAKTAAGRLLIAAGLCLILIPLPAQRMLHPGRSAVTAIVTGCDSSEEYVERDGSWRTQYIITAQYTSGGGTYEYRSDPQSENITPGSEITLLVDPDSPESAVAAPPRAPAQAALAAGAVLTGAGIFLLTKPKRR